MLALAYKPVRLSDPSRTVCPAGSAVFCQLLRADGVILARVRARSCGAQSEAKALTRDMVEKDLVFAGASGTRPAARATAIFMAGRGLQGSSSCTRR